MRALRTSASTTEMVCRCLKTVSFRIEPGQKPCGESVPGRRQDDAVPALPRFYDVSSGSVTVDRTDVRDVTERA